MAPEVSAIIPTYNRAMAAAAVESVLAQGGVDFELVVVDDGSTDSTCERMRETYGSNPRWRMIRIEHRGPAAARNAGVAAGRAPMVAFLDSDDLWASGKLARQVRFMREHREYRISQCNEYWMREGRRVNPARRHLKRAGDIFIESLRTCLISPSAVIMEKSLFDEMHGFDEDFAAAEDYDLWLRILAEHEVGLLDEELVTRRAGHGDQLSATVVAIDRFRVLTLMKLLQNPKLAAERRAAVSDALVEKVGIYSKGLRRRGRGADADFHEALAREAQTRWRDRGDASLADAICKLRRMLRAQALGG
jgi:glycosyltransferase involved in cell wall biosynthesis